MLDLSNFAHKLQLTKQIQDDIESASKFHFKDDPRKHLGASIIGHECAAYCWNTFRWLKIEEFSGRMFRLFNRGHLEEKRFIEFLQWIGFEVHEIDPITKKQFRISSAGGHFGGSLDGILIPPARYGTNRQPLLGEFKTHNAKSFAKLLDKKLIAAKPQHYKQMCTYGPYYECRQGLYCAVNKDTDDLYFEIVDLDYKLGQEMVKRGEDIITSPVQSPKISMVKTFFTCKICHFSGICHDGEMPEKNCRSCEHSIPIDNGEWACKFHNVKLEYETIYKGCDSWRRII